MDVDWCLSCSRQNAPDSPYCADCLDNPPTPDSHHSYNDDSTSESFDSCAEDDLFYYTLAAAPITPRWAGTGPEGIAAWARHVSCGPPQNTPPKEILTFPKPPAPRHTFRPPKLLHSQRPTLCMSTPKPSPPQPSLPITTPQQQIASLALTHSKSAEFGSMPTSFTDSIATPSSLLTSDANTSRKCTTTAMLDALASQVRSWVSPFSLVHRPKPLPSFVPKPAPSSVRRPESAAFTLLAKAGSTRALHPISPSSVIDESHSEEEWWVSTTRVASTASLNVEKKAFSKEAMRSGVHTNHPAYRSRGRKLSRALS